ncbi:MAG: amidohydrolase [Candidatus Bathyarchaeum sp.]|nr:MAG: amidohydrolase [Candidatus Bathyarchaeum sp.]
MEADLVLLDCNVLTMNPSQPHAEALAIKGDRIVKVGTKEEISKWIGKSTKIIELKNGETIVPGLIDTHVHIADFGRFLTWLDLKGVKSIEEMQKIIEKRAQETPLGKWILGQGWDQTSFTEKRYPNIQDLDETSLDHPIVLYHQSGCMCVVNSKALELAGVTKETDAPSGGTIEHDPETGEPTGVFRENAMNLIWKIIPEPGEEEVLDATSLACEKIVEAGVTSVHWIVSSWIEVQTILRLRAENRLPLRVYIIFPADILDQITALRSREDFEDYRVWIGGVEIFADGFLAARTASLKEPYSDNLDTKGKLRYTQEEINVLVAKLHKANFRLVIHAMGDQAIDIVLCTLEKILKELPRENHRYRIEHAAVLNNELIQCIKKLDVTVAVQPCTIISEFTDWSATDRLGLKRARWLYPLKTLFDEGIRVSGGSDCPMEQLSPFAGIQAAVTRQFFPEEQITVDEALRMYTVNAAYASFNEDITGSIEEGKLADLTVVSRDPRITPPNEIEDIKVKMTIVGGKMVYQK